MRLTPPFILSVTLLVFASEDLLAQNYLTKEGQLTQQLRVVQLQGGFAGFTGVQYTIAPDDSWTSESIFNEKKTPKNKGKLSEKDLAKLGALLEKYDLAKEKNNISPLLAAEPKVHRDLAYAEPKNERQMLDVYAPTQGKGLPVVLWIHGGGWRRGDKGDVHNKPKAFTEKGFVLVSINYRFVPNVTIKQMAGDVAKAIRWTHDHAKDYGGDPTTIIVMGHSAGAQLAALVCTDDRYLKAEKLPLSIIKACVPVDGGTYDVALQVKTVDEKRANSLRTTFGDAESQKELSSVTHIAQGKNIPPFLILHIADNPETKAQSERLAKALDEVGIAAEVYSAAGKTHTTITTDLGIADDRPTQEMFGFLNMVLKK